MIEPMRAALAALLLALPAAPALAGDEAGDAIRRMQDQWGKADEAARAALLEPLVASADPRALAAVAERALADVRKIEEWRKRREEIPKRLEELAKPGAVPSQAKEADNLRADLDAIPGWEERTRKALALLSRGTARLLDALPDPGFAGPGRETLRGAFHDTSPGVPEWLAEAVGGSRKDRTAVLLLDLAADALLEYRKQLADRASPARKLDEINQKIAKIVHEYVLQEQKKGNPYPVGIPVALLGTLSDDQKDAEKVLRPIQEKMDAAAGERAGAALALGRMIAGAADVDRGRLLDLIEKKVLGDPDFEVRAFGAAVLAPVPGERAFSCLKAAAADPDPRILVAALEAIGARTESEAVDLLAARLADPRWHVRAAAAAGLARTGRAAAVPPLVEAMAKAEGRTVDDFHEALRLLTGQNFPAAAAAWKEWWDREGKSFKGPKDPGGTAAGGAGTADAPAPAGGEAGTAKAGERVSFYGIETRSQRILFVLDFSGSMSWQATEKDRGKSKIDVLRQELRRTLTGLPDGSRFNLVAFSSDVRVWRKVPAAADAKTRAEAIDWVEKQKVVGSTNIYDALERGFQMMGVGAAKDKSYEPAFDTVFFMTDGTPTSGKVREPERILAEVRRWNEARRVRVHVIGMGGHEKGEQARAGAAGKGQDDLDEDFLKKLADQNGGQLVLR